MIFFIHTNYITNLSHLNISGIDTTVSVGGALNHDLFAGDEIGWGAGSNGRYRSGRTEENYF
jgi:hypothetical protein